MNNPGDLWSADLSEYINNALVQKFEKLTLEDQVAVSYICPTDDRSPLLDKSRTLIFASTVPPTLQTLPNPEEHQPKTAGQTSHFQSIKQSWTITNSALSSETHISRFLSLRNTVVLAKSRKGRLNIKRNLTPAEIGPVASGLITGDSIPFFLNNFQPIFDVWISFLTTKTSVRSANHAVVAAFDVLYDLVTDGRDTRFLLRFAYVQLAEAIDALVKVASANRRAGHVHGGAGYKDESVYIDVYLTAKGKPLNNLKLRNELSGHKRISRRFREITNLSLLLLAVYSDDAKSIVYVLLLPINTPSKELISQQPEHFDRPA
jgi:hypothetical protein